MVVSLSSMLIIRRLWRIASNSVSQVKFCAYEFLAAMWSLWVIQIGLLDLWLQFMGIVVAFDL